MPENIATLVARFVGDTTGLKAATDSAQRDLSRFQAQAGISGRNAATSFAAAGAAWRSMAGVIGGVSIAAGINQMVNQAAQFERRINVIRAQSQATEAQMRALSATTRQLGLEFGVGARSAANAAGELLKAGLSVEDVNSGALESAVVLAQALESDIAPAAQIAAIATTVFGESAENLDTVVQGVAATVLSGKFELNDYALAMQQGGSAARLAGLSLDDFNTLLILLQRNIGGSGSDMGTLARVFLSRLVPASAEAERRMAALGLQFFNADGSARTLAQRAEELRRVFGNMSDEARAQNFNDLFGIDGLRAASALMSEGAEGVEHWRQEIESGAQATGLAAAQTAGFAGATRGLASAFEDLGISIEQSGLGQILESLTRWATGGVQSLSSGFLSGESDARGGLFERDLMGLIASGQNDPALAALRARGRALARTRGHESQQLSNREALNFALQNMTAAEVRQFLETESVPDRAPWQERLALRDTFAGAEIHRLATEAARRRGQLGRQRGNLGGASRPAADPTARSRDKPATPMTPPERATWIDRQLAGAEDSKNGLWARIEAEFAAMGQDDPIVLDGVDVEIRRWDLEQQQLRETAERFSKDVHDALRDAWINDEWDFGQIGQRIEQAMRAALWDALLGDSIQNFIEGLATRFARMLARWVNEAIAEIPSGDQGSGGAGSGSGGGNWFAAIANAVGDFFAGFFATGGQIGPGQWGVAGENGPEPIYGGRTGVTVFPAGESQGGGTTNVFHIDARGADAGVESRIRLAVEEAVQRGAQAGAAMVFKKVRAGRTM